MIATHGLNLNNDLVPNVDAFCRAVNRDRSKAFPRIPPQPQLFPFDDIPDEYKTVEIQNVEYPYMQHFEVIGDPPAARQPDTRETMLIFTLDFLFDAACGS